MGYLVEITCDSVRGGSWGPWFGLKRARRTAVQRAVQCSALASLAIGCASAPATPALRNANESPEELATLREAQQEQLEQIQELQSRLALARAEAADLRASIHGTDAEGLPESVTIGTARSPSEAGDSLQDGWVEPWEEGVWREPALAYVEPDGGQDSSGPRPMLRLHGTPRPVWPDPALPPVTSLPPIPSTAPLRLPVSGSVPALPAPGMVALPAAAGTRPPAPSQAVVLYRGALRHVRDRRFGDALREFDRFLDDYPRHPYVQNALYWRGEVLYAQRSYRTAKGAFQLVLERFPRGSKVPEALLKIALCQFRLGNDEAGERALARLRREYPDSVAARTAVSGGVRP